MKDNKQFSICITVTFVRGVAVVDGPNVVHENICKIHDRRNCPSCKRKHKNFDDENYWDRTFDLHRLEMLDSALEQRGYKAIIWIKWGTYNYAKRKAKKFPEIQFSLLQRMVDEGIVITPKPDSDDIWWITMAWEMGAIIVTNDTFKDRKFGEEVQPRERTNYPLLNWKEIDDKTYRYEFQPETCLRDEEQKLLIPDLPKHPDLTPEEWRESEIERLRKRLEELEAERSAAQIEDIISEVAMTTNEEMAEENHTFNDEIIQSWDAAFEQGGGDQAYCYGSCSIWENLLSNICSVMPVHGRILTPSDPDNEFLEDRYGLREKLGYSKKTSWRTILENQLVIYSEYIGREIKFVNNPYEISSVGERVYFVDSFPDLENHVEEIKKKMGDENEE